MPAAQTATLISISCSASAPKKRVHNHISLRIIALSSSCDRNATHPPQARNVRRRTTRKKAMRNDRRYTSFLPGHRRFRHALTAHSIVLLVSQGNKASKSSNESGDLNAESVTRAVQVKKNDPQHSPGMRLRGPRSEVSTKDGGDRLAVSPTCAVNASAEPRRTSDRRTATAPATHKRSDRTRPPRHNELRGAPRLPRSGRAAGHRSWAPPAATSTSAQQAAGPHLGGFFVHSGRPGWVPAAAIARQGPGAREGGEDAVALVRAAPDGHREDPPPGGVGPPTERFMGTTSTRRCKRVRIMRSDQ